MEENLYTPEELAKKLKLSKYTIYEMIKRGDIPAHHVGRSLRISESQLELYLLSTGKSENIFSCTIVEDGDLKYADINGVKISISTDLTGTAKISISPEDVILSVGKFVSSARNMHFGRVIDIIYDKSSAKVILDIGIPLYALITAQSLLDMNIKKGTELYAIFKTMSVKVF